MNMFLLGFVDVALHVRQFTGHGSRQVGMIPYLCDAVHNS